MSFFLTTFFLVLLSATANNVSCSTKHVEMVGTAREGLLRAMSWAQGLETLNGPDRNSASANQALRDCVKLYKEAEPVGAASASHTTCLDGLGEKGVLHEAHWAQNLTRVIREALAVHGDENSQRRKREVREGVGLNNGGLLASWDATTSEADFVVAQDGSGDYKTINEAVDALAQLRQNRSERVVVYVKSGVYNENVEIGGDLKNIMFVGDGIDGTIVVSNKNVQDGATTLNSATFIQFCQPRRLTIFTHDLHTQFHYSLFLQIQFLTRCVSGDGFWARDMTFENMAGPEKHQAVALRVSSDLSVFYRCGFKGYQDTLFVHSLRQFYRECQIYGTVDFIFGDAAVILQQCDIFVRRPMDHQSNVITAQGRDDPNENTGISILNSRVMPSFEFRDVKGNFKSYLGRPWKKYSRTVFLKTDLDGLVDERGWKEWNGDFALSTLYYAEYMNTRSRGLY
ncbi:hypothetical protein OROGR_031996 [Orobanche gracilis]